MIVKDYRSGGFSRSGGGLGSAVAAGVVATTIAVATLTVALLRLIVDVVELIMKIAADRRGK